MNVWSTVVLIRLLSFQILCTFLWIDLFRLIFAVTLISCGECFHSKTSHLYTYYHFRGENSNRLQYTHHPWDNLFAYCFSTFFKREYDMFRSPCRPHLINIRLKWLIINRLLWSWFPFFFDLHSVVYLFGCKYCFIILFTFKRQLALLRICRWDITSVQIARIMGHWEEK